MLRKWPKSDHVLPVGTFQKPAEPARRLEYTLLFGLSALATNVEGFRLSTGTKVPLSLAAGFLVLAAVAGIMTNAPRRKDAIAIATLAPLLDDKWWSSEAKDALQATARAELKIAEAARRTNHRTARYLLAGIVLEICGVACVTWAVIALISAA